MNREHITFRGLTDSDEKLVFDWISAQDLRRMTGTRGMPNQEGHHVWFEKKKTDENNIIRIILFNDQPVGLIGTTQFDVTFKNATMFLYIGDSKNRGKGIGKEAIVHFAEFLFDDKSIHKITAEIFEYNMASRKAFEKAGFTLEGIQKEQVIDPNEEGSFCDLYLYGLIKKGE